MNERMNESINQSNTRHSMERLYSEISALFSRTIDESVNEWLNQWTNERTKEWKNQSINQWINEWMNEWMNEWINQSINQTEDTQWTGFIPTFQPCLPDIPPPNNSKFLHFPACNFNYFGSAILARFTTFFVSNPHSCGAVYCNWSRRFICGSVTTINRNCVHRSSPNWVCR